MELKEFKQKENETIEVYYDRLNELIYRCNCYGITITTRKQPFNDAQTMTLADRGRAYVRALKNNVSFAKFEG